MIVLTIMFVDGDVGNLGHLLDIEALNLCPFLSDCLILHLSEMIMLFQFDDPF